MSVARTTAATTALLYVRTLGCTFWQVLAEDAEEATSMFVVVDISDGELTYEDLDEVIGDAAVLGRVWVKLMGFFASRYPADLPS